MDAWGHPFIYQPPVQPQAFATLVSYGADGAPGGTGDNLDIEFRLTEHGISRPWIFP
jgi:general secretion pathway protein G